MHQQRRPLVEALQQFHDKQPISFHVPGHKNGMLSTLPIPYKAALRYDVTELTTLDDLHYPEECILEAQQLLQQAYKSDASFFLVNGSTVGNLAMIYATCQRGDVVLVQRNAHKSIFHALELVEAVPVLLTPNVHEVSKTAGYVEVETLEQALQQHPEAKAVIITSPTYYGVMAPQLKRFIDRAHEANIAVLVDEAHGAHFAAHANMPHSALALGADVVVQSAHKMLNAMTMASFLHVRSDIVNKERIAKYLRMLQSSSPSYVLLASLDDARYCVANYSDSDYRYMMHERHRFIAALRKLKGVIVVEVNDPLKLCVRVEGYNGFQLKNALEAERVFIELADNEQVLFVLPLLMAEQTYPYDEAITAITRAVATLHTQQQVYTQLPILNYTTPVTKIEPIYDTKTELVSFNEAVGRKSAAQIVPYPPGIPLLVKGEVITAAHIQAMIQYEQLSCPIQGEHEIKTQQLYVTKE